MDITSLIGTLLSSDSISGVSKTTKSSSNDVTSILTAALPLLLDGAKAQAEDTSTAASFSKALASHGKDDTSDIASFLKNVDMEDGGKIIRYRYPVDSHWVQLEYLLNKSGKVVNIDLKYIP